MAAGPELTVRPSPEPRPLAATAAALVNVAFFGTESEEVYNLIKRTLEDKFF